MNSQKQKYLFCYLRTGGGHLAPARSVAQHLSRKHGDTIEPVLIDGLVEAKKIARYIIEDGYRLLQAKAKWYYEFLYATNKFPPIGYFNIVVANFFIKPYIKKKIQEELPAKIVVFHFFLITPVYQVLKELNLTIPVITVVTDPYTAHPLWFQRKQQQFILFSERLKQHCLHRGINENHLTVFPFVIDEKFSLPLSSKQMSAVQSQFGFDTTKKIILIIGGGDGIPHGKMILQNLLVSSLHAHSVIVCGKNKQLYKEAMELKTTFPALTVFGFVDFVYELLAVADIVVTKCGASTIMEILMMKKIPIIIDYLWEQELGNMEFVRDNHLGVFERNISKLPSIVEKIITNEQYASSFLENIKKQNLRSGTKDVANYLIQW